MSLAFVPFVPLVPKARYKGLTPLPRYFNTRAVIRNSDSCKLENVLFDSSDFA